MTELVAALAAVLELAELYVNEGGDGAPYQRDVAVVDRARSLLSKLKEQP